MPLQSTDPRVVFVETLGLACDRVSEQAEIVSEAFGDAVEMPPSLFGRTHNIPAQLRTQLPNVRPYRSKASVH